MDPIRRAQPAATLTCLVEATTPATTKLSLRRACRDRAIEFDEVTASELDPLGPPLAPGALLYNAATSVFAAEAEARLWQPGVGTVFRNRLGPLRQIQMQEMALARCGLPVPLGVSVRTRDSDTLDRYLRALGGLPVIVRVEGGEGGQRVSRADSLPGLRSMIELLLSLGNVPRMVSYVPDAMHVRVVVVGGRAVASYDNPPREGDFRSSPSEDPDHYHSLPTDDAAELAVAACEALEVDLGGVDVLRHASGRLYVLEVNTPCYFHQAERFGADVSGPLVDALLASAARHGGGAAAERP